VLQKGSYAQATIEWTSSSGELLLLLPVALADFVLFPLTVCIFYKEQEHTQLMAKMHSYLGKPLESVAQTRCFTSLLKLWPESTVLQFKHKNHMTEELSLNLFRCTFPINVYQQNVEQQNVSVSFIRDCSFHLFVTFFWFYLLPWSLCMLPELHMERIKVWKLSTGVAWKNIHLNN